MKSDELREIVDAMTDRPWHLDDDTPCAYAGDREVMVCGDEVGNYDGDMPGVIALANHAAALVELLAACEELIGDNRRRGDAYIPEWNRIVAALTAVHAVGGDRPTAKEGR